MGFLACGAGNGETSRAPLFWFCDLDGAGSYEGGWSDPLSSSSRESLSEAISKPSSSCAIYTTSAFVAIKSK
jgi:hypothetical protein